MTGTTAPTLSVIILCFNDEATLEELRPGVLTIPGADLDVEIVILDVAPTTAASKSALVQVNATSDRRMVPRADAADRKLLSGLP